MDCAEDTLLAINDLTAGYGPISVLKGVTLQIQAGEIVTIIGANGAGKTTTLMCISGVNRVSGGSVVFAGSEITNHPAHQIVARGLVQVPEGRKVFARLTVQENLELGSYLFQDKVELAIRLAEVFELFPVLAERRRQLGGTLSGGEQQMLAIGRALLARPRLLLMDEPSMGIAPQLVQRIFETIEALNKQGLAILLVEQNAHMALQIAKRGYVMEIGSVVMEDTAENLRNHPRVRAAYLGQ